MTLTEADRLIRDIEKHIGTHTYPFRIDCSAINQHKAWRFYYINGTDPYEVGRILELDNGEPYVALRTKLDEPLDNRKKVKYFERLLLSQGVALEHTDIHVKEFQEI